jgi:acyl dehydratase
MADPLYLDDFALGQRFSHPARPVMDLDRMKQFAAEFDPQPFHMDEDAAIAHPLFSGLAASGWHTAAVTARLLVESVPFADGLIGLGVEVSWPRPTRAGDELSVVTEVIGVTPSRSKPDRGVVTLRTETRNQHGELVQVLTTKVMVPRRADSQQAEFSN